MMLRGQSPLRSAALYTVILMVSGCSDNDREQPLSRVDTVPPANPGTQTNQNINNPTLTIPTTFDVSPGDALTLVWSDEFDGAALDPETWFFATGDGSEVGLSGGWGNNELQYYLPDNAQLENGVLKITARRETIGGLNHTSARINTEDRFAFQYGRIEASIKLPSGQGLWPAFWMLSQDSTYQCDGRPCNWAAVGEMDIMEAINLDGTGGNEIFATIHYGGEFPANASSSVTYTPGPDVTEDFHIYAMEWDATEIRWYFDGDLYAVQNNWFSTAAPYPAPFDQPFHILLNLAVGGNFPGNAIDGNALPATMEVDWVRVYSGEDEPPPPPPPPLPVDFEGSPVTYDFGMDAGFGGGASDVIANPDMSGINNSAQTARMQKFAGEVFGGSTLALTGDVDFTAGEVFKVKVWASRAVPVLFKFEGLNKERSVDHSGSGSWEEMCFDFTADTAGAASNAISFIFDLGVNGDAAGDPNNWTFYFDDIQQTTSCAGGGSGGGTFVNGDFETGDFTGWTLTQDPPGSGSITLDSSGQGGRAGTVARLVAAGSDVVGTNDVLIGQVALAAGTVSPGDAIGVSFDLYGSLTGAGGVVFVEVIFLDGAGQDNGRNFVGPAAPYTPTGTWMTHSGTVTAGTTVGGGSASVSGGVTLELKVACGAIVGGCGVDASFDNVTFTINGEGG